MAPEIRQVALCTLFLSACAAPGGEDDPAEEADRSAALPETHYVDIDKFGRFDPPSLSIREGDIVVWRFFDRYDSVVRIKPGGLSDPCNQPTAAEPSHPLDFTGPMSTSAGGIFVLNPSPKKLRHGFGLVPVDEADADDPARPCGTFEDRGQVGTVHLCAQGEAGAAMDTTWADRSTTGVFIRLNWSALNPAEGVYDLEVLENEVRNAVDNGKLYSLAIEAGSGGTPDWIFDTTFVEGGGTGSYVHRPGGGGGVRRVHLQDHGDHPDDTDDCGVQMDLGAPFDEDYQEHYFALLSEVADLLKSRADWYRALAYIKPSGANMFTAENRLPKSCDEGCLCNTKAWSNAGYRPRFLYDFYEAQHEHLAREFPGKTMSYQVIHDGFPLVNGAGGYLDENGVFTVGEEIGVTEQTKEIIDRGHDHHGWMFAVQHNGLHPLPADPCPGADGCPNNMVRQQDTEGPIGYQTQNTSDISDIRMLDSALLNATNNTAAGMIEIYEERLWEAQQTVDGVLDRDGSGRTLADWDEALRERRFQTSNTHTHHFIPFLASPKTLYYIHGSKCDPKDPHYAEITVYP
jgi:hypothetical protein